MNRKKYKIFLDLQPQGERKREFISHHYRKLGCIR